MKKTILSLALLSAALLSSCSGVTRYEDTNGAEDFSLNTITREMLVSNKTNSLSIGSVSTSDDNKFVLSCAEFHGVKDVYKMTIKESVAYNVSTTVTSGNFALVILNNGEIYKEATINVQETYVFPANLGKIVFRIAGEKANFKVQIDKGSL